MFVDPTRGRSKRYAKYALGTAAGVLLLGACNDPQQNTGLRPEGPPDVLAVLVLTDAVTQLAETATYCRIGDDKRPTQVGLPDFTLSQICDADPSVPASMVTAAYPDGWYVRIMFDELLDPRIEELTEILDPDTGEGTDTFSGSIANTQPVKLECESVAGGFVEVPYDGYYSPAGNAVTWPLGPALVIKPDEPRAIATNKMCRITLRANITDKNGNAVPEDQRGPYPFKIAPIMPIAIDPPDDPDGASPINALQIYFDNVYVQFNTSIDPASICDEGTPVLPATTGTECEFEIVPETEGVCSIGNEYCIIGGPACPAGSGVCEKAGYYGYAISETETGWGPVAPVQTDKSYTFQFKQGTKLKDRCGVETTFGAPSAGDNTLTRFTTNPFNFVSLVPGNGDTVSPLRKPTLLFNNVLDPSTLANTEYSITPAPANASVATTSGSDGDFVFAGNYQPATMYTFTFNAGATVTDAYGVPYTNATAKTITYTTQPIAVTSLSPVNNGTSVKATPASVTTLSVSFNQNMVPASLDAATEVTLTSTTNTTAIPLAATVAAASTCGPTRTSCTLQVKTAAPLAPGSYKLTLKAGATVSDVLGNVYTQAADRVVTFTVANIAPAVVCL